MLGVQAAPRSLGWCADHGMSLRTYCAGCEQITVIPAGQVCSAFRPWTVDQMQRAGVLGCQACRQRVSMSVYGEYWGRPMQIEHWGEGAGYVRAFSDGMSG